MTFFHNTNQEFGCSGPFESKSVETAVEEMEETFQIWATDAYHNTNPEDVIELSQREWTANRVSQLREDYADQLEEYEQ